MNRTKHHERAEQLLSDAHEEPDSIRRTQILAEAQVRSPSAWRRQYREIGLRRHRFPARVADATMWANRSPFRKLGSGIGLPACPA